MAEGFQGEKKARWMVTAFLPLWKGYRERVIYGSTDLVRITLVLSSGNPLSVNDGAVHFKAY